MPQTDTVIARRKCPKCNKGYLDSRTPRAWWIKTLLFWLPIRRYKCSYCNKKTYVYGPPKPTPGDDNGNTLEVIRSDD